MKILAIHRHYDCDAFLHGGGIRAVVEQQARSGRDLTVFTSQSRYHEVHHPPRPQCEGVREVNTKRIRLLPEKQGWGLVRAINAAWFYLRALIHATISCRYDVIIASNRPPVLIGLVLRTIRALRGTPYIYLCPDLFPESAVPEDLKRGRLYNRLLRWDTVTCKNARRTIVPSPEMAETLAARGVLAERISVIGSYPVVANPIMRPILPPPFGDRDDMSMFLFVGDLDRHRGLERLIAAARLVAARLPFQLVFMGDGNAKRELVELAVDLVGRRIVFVPTQSVETAVAAMRHCDYGIVSLAVDAHRCTYTPESHLYGLAGCPVIALVEPQSELAQTIGRHGLGIVVPSRSVTSIAETILNAVVERRQWTAQRRLQLEQRCHALYGDAATQHAWNDIIADTSAQTIVLPPGGRASKAA